MKIKLSWRDLLLCTLTGVLTFAAFPTIWAPELDLWPLIWISHLPLFWVLKDKPPKQAFRWGLYTGIVINTGGYYWLSELFVTFGHLPLPLAMLVMLLHSVWMGSLWGVWAWLINRIVNTTRLPLEWAAPLVMVAVEIAIPRIFPAFMGNSQVGFTWIMQICDLFGVSAVTFLIYRVNAVLYLWLRARIEGRNRPYKALWITAAMMGLSLLYGGVRVFQIEAEMEAAKHLKLGIVEGDVGIFERESQENIQNHLLIQQNLSAKLEAQGAELLLWAESSYRFQPLKREAKDFPPARSSLSDNFRQDIRRRIPSADRAAPIRGFKTPVILGGTSIEPREEPRWEGDLPIIAYNSAWLLDGAGAVAGFYDKVHLLMFGEYVPFAHLIPWIYKLIPAAGDLSAGKKPGIIEADLWGKGPIRLGMLICYEGLLAPFTRRLSQGHPHLLINMTNDDWFGLTPERYLHLALAVPRAIEHRLAYARPTLTGVSAFVDPVGRLVKITRPLGAETLLWNAPLLQSSTVYLIIGDSFAYLCLLLSLGFFAWGKLRRRGPLWRRRRGR